MVCGNPEHSLRYHNLIPTSDLKSIWWDFTCEEPWMYINSCTRFCPFCLQGWKRPDKASMERHIRDHCVEFHLPGGSFPTVDPKNIKVYNRSMFEKHFDRR